MNLVRISPGSDLELGRPPTVKEVAGQEGMLVFPRVEDISPDSSLAEELGPGVLDKIKTAACWRQVSFHSEQISRLYGPQDPDPNRNMTPEMAEIHRGELAKHLSTLGIVEASVTRSPDVRELVAA